MGNWGVILIAISRFWREIPTVHLVLEDEPRTTYEMGQDKAELELDPQAQDEAAASSKSSSSGRLISWYQKEERAEITR